MHIEVTKNEKHDVELKIDNLTIAEILRAYLYKADADFAAWRREHPSKPFVMKITVNDGSVKKIVSDAISMIKKDCDALLKNVRKSSV